MFDDALLDSSSRRSPVLRRIHYLLAGFVGTVVFAQGFYLLPLVLTVTAMRALTITAATAAVTAAGWALMLCYVSVDTKQQGLTTWRWLITTLLLNLPGFLIYLGYAAAKSGDWKRAALSLAYVTEAVLVGILVLVPLIYTEALPSTLLMTYTHISPPRGRPPAPAGAPARVRETPPRTVDLLHARIVIPDRVVQIAENRELPQAGSFEGPVVAGALPDGSSEGPLNAVIGSMPWGGEPPAPPPPHTPPKPSMVRRGGDVIAAMALYQPRPVYPPLAMLARVQGTVVLQAIIGRDGSVQDLKVASGPALLIKAAVDAVKTWRYQPTLLNGEAVDVLTEISVNFKLAQ